MSSSSQRTLVILDERGAAARLPSQIASLVQGYRIIHLSDTRHAPYATLSRVSAARLVLLCLDLVRGLGEAGKDAPGRLVEAQRAQVGTYVLGSAEAARVADRIRRSDPDAVIVEADAALAAEVALALEAEPATGKTASTVIRCATEASEHWQERVAELAGVAPDAVAGRWVMPAGPSEGPFSVAMDEDGDPLD